jgi:hypothetical protein
VYPEAIQIFQMNVRQEMAKKILRLAPDHQEQGLRFASSSPAAVLMGENGASLRQFSHYLDPVSAKQTD